jgi:hypothetical protein
VQHQQPHPQHVVYTQVAHEASSDSSTASKNVVTLVLGLLTAGGLGAGQLVSHSSNADAAGAAAQNATFAHNDVKELTAENALIKARLEVLESQIKLLKTADKNISADLDLHQKKRRH